MTALDFYKFIFKNRIEYHWADNAEEKDVVFFVSFDEAKELNKLLDASILDESGIECHMKNGYLAFWADEILSHYGIELKDIFEEDDE